jgi:Tfp pilus assembly protein PilF
MKPLHFVVFSVVVAAGLGGSAFLIPRQADLGLMYFKDRQYAAARSIYEKRLAAGAPSVDVVMPLAELYTQSGEVSRAVDLLQRFASHRADKVDLIQRIGKFQQYEQRPEDYLKTLEEINRRKSSEESLRELANLFRYTNQNSKLIATLQLLVAKYPSNPSDFLELANLQVIGGHAAEAAATMERLEAKQPRAITADTVELLLSLLLDSAQGNRALERAARWLALHRDADGAARLAALLNFKGQPALALRLLEPFEGMADSNPVLLGQWIQLQIANGHADLGFERLERLRREKRMPDEMAESFVDLALGRHQLPLAIEMAGDRGLRRLPDWLLANLADAALFGKREDFAHRMVAALGEGFLRDRPLLAARLANARKDAEAATRWLQLAAANPHLRTEDTMAIAGLYASLGRPQEAFAQISRLPLESLPDTALMETARLYISLGRVREGVDRFDRLLAATAKPGAGAAWSLLAASVGRGPEVARWLASAPSRWLVEDTLRDLYFIAADHKQTALALAAARRIFILKSNDTNRLLLANALIAAEQSAEALPHVRMLVSGGGLSRGASGIEETYTAALLGAIRALPRGTAAPLQAELREFWTAKLRHSGKDERQRLDLVYGLLELEAWDAVLPQLKSLAHGRGDLAPLYIETALKAGRQEDALAFLRTELQRHDLSLETREARLYALIEHGGQAEALPYIRPLALASIPVWISAYEEALKKLRLTGELVEFWRARAARAGVQPDERRSLAFQLLDAGHKDWAESIFEELARTARPDHADVSELLFLWGQKPDADSLKWLEDRARRAAGPERAAWLNHLIDCGAAGRAAAIASASLPPPGQGGALLDVYLRALGELRDGRKLGAVVTREVQAVNDPDRLRSLARMARDSGEIQPAEKAYVKLLALAPADREARHWLGVSAFSRSNYSAAERYLGDLLRSSEGAYDDNFYYGEMLWRKRDRASARVYYGRALRAIERTPSPPLEALVARAQSLFRCGYVELSLREFRSLVAANPPAVDRQRNGDLRADFGALLLENGMYGEAEALLSGGGDSGGSRLALLRAHLLAATARKSEALELLENLTELNPNAARALADLGLLDESGGQRRRARALFERAESLDPENEDLREARTSLEYEQAPQIRAEAEIRRIQGAQSENRLRIRGDRQITEALRLQFTFDQDWASIRRVRLTGGSIAPFDGVRKHGEASLDREWESGTLLRGSLFAGGATLGAGAAVTRPDARGSTTVQLEFHRPYWEFAESLAQEGVRDRVEVSRETNLGQRLSARFGGAWNRYSLKPDPSAAETVAAESVVAAGGLAFRLSARPQVTLEYSVDAEYRLSARTGADAGGTPFQPLPLASREVHAATIRIAQPVTRNLRVEGASGFAADRFGGYAPFLNLNVNYAPRGRLSVQLNYDRRLYTLDTARTVTSFGGKLSWRF